MKGGYGVDTVDQAIVRVLSLYDHLTPLQVWFEMGESDLIKVRLTEAEVVDRLESLRAGGFVETIARVQAGGHPTYLDYRVTSGVSNNQKE